MSHDIRTPMNAIIGITTLMENELHQPEKLAEHLAKLESSGQLLLGIINDILDMSRIESGIDGRSVTCRTGSQDQQFAVSDLAHDVISET
jgi:signal transduction histidine kinase